MSEKEKKALNVQQVTRHVRALLISAPNGLNIVEIQNDYLNIIGKPFPYRELGFKEPIELLKAMPDVVQPTWVRGELILRGIADQTSEHIAKLVAKQRSSSKRRATQVIRKKPLLPPSAPPYIRSKIQELLTFYPNGILGSSFLMAFSRHFQIELDFKRLGFSLLQDLLKSIPDIARIENIKLGGYKVYGKCVSKIKPADVNCTTSLCNNSNVIKPLFPKTNTNNEVNLQNQVKKLLNSQSGVSQLLKNEIGQVLSKRPNGVWAARLPIEYKNFFDKELKMRDHGFTTIVELADAMSDIVRIERPTETGDWLLYGLQQTMQCEDRLAVIKPSQDQASNRNSSQYPSTSSNNSKPVCGRALQVGDGVGQGTYFEKPIIPESGYVTLYITHCVDPQNFYIMFIEDWPKLEALSKDISILYDSPDGDRYLMPQWLVSVGQVCCAWCEDYEDWFRAVITGFTSMKSIEVFYVDYGNNSRVSLTELRVLRSSFLKIPGQACHAQLAYIRPVTGTEWSPGCCHRFYHLTKNYKALFGLFCGVKDGKICLCLSDTSSNEDIHINDLLVDEGYAVFCPDLPLSPISPVRPFFDANIITEKANKEKHNKPPGLPPARKGQDVFNQHIASSIASTTLPEFAFQMEPLSNGHLIPNSYDATTDPNSPPVVNPEPNDSIAFIEEICEEINQDDKEEYIFKQISLVNICTIHVINYHKVPYVTSADISVLLWDSDVLRAMLRQKKMVVPKLVLSNEEDCYLIEELVKHEVRGVMDGDTQRSFVTLYPLSSVPDILRKFNHPLEELVSRVELEIRQYEEEGEDYWHVKDTGSESTGTDSECRDEDLSSQMEQLAIDELRLVIQALQFRRKRILQDLMTPTPNGTQNTVEELVDVEQKIEKLRREVSRKERQN